MSTSIEDAQYNAAHRILKKYGKFPSLDEMIAEKEVPPAALFTYRKQFQAPEESEGFNELEVVKFRRRLDPQVYKNKAVILDFDGTLRRSTGDHRTGNNRRIEYPFQPDEVEILPGRAEILQRCLDDGYHLLGVSNQSGIGKGTISEDDAVACFERTCELLDVKIDYRFCPHYAFPVKCWCHKPMPGLGVQLVEEYKLDISQCIMVGDLKKDEQFSQGMGFMYLHADKFFQGKGWRPPVFEVP